MLLKSALYSKVCVYVCVRVCVRVLAKRFGLILILDANNTYTKCFIDSIYCFVFAFLSAQNRQTER